MGALKAIMISIVHELAISNTQPRSHFIAITIILIIGLTVNDEPWDFWWSSTALVTALAIVFRTGVRTTTLTFNTFTETRFIEVSKTSDGAVNVIAGRRRRRG